MQRFYSADIHICLSVLFSFLVFFIFNLQRVPLDGFCDGELDEGVLQDARYDILEFAKKYFRCGRKGRG